METPCLRHSRQWRAIPAASFNPRRRSNPSAGTTPVAHLAPGQAFDGLRIFSFEKDSIMTKTSKTLAAAALALFAVAGTVHAEEYEGVLQFNSNLSRTEVQAQGVAAAHGPDLYAEGAMAHTTPVMSAPRLRASVQAEAVVAAHAPDQNVKVGSRGDQRFFAGIAPSTVVGGTTWAIGRSSTQGAE